MWSLVRVVRGVGLLVFVFAFFQGTGIASAATGSVLADLTPPGPTGGVNVAFDGQYLWYTDLNGAVLHRAAPDGTPQPDVPIVGAAGINALTYDSTRDLFWGVDATGLNVYQVHKDGTAWVQFTLVPALDLPGLCNSLTGCSSTVSGLAFDATDDSLWYVPQGSSRVYHFDTAGEPLGYFDTSDLPDCASNNATGIAAGANALYLTAGSCTRGFQYSKTGSKLSSFSVGGVQSAGASCDNVSFSNATAMWVRDSSTGHLRAIQVASNTCVFGGGIAIDPTRQWMTGAGQAMNQGQDCLDQFTGQNVCPLISHAFHLLCSTTTGTQPNNFVANWKDASGNKFSFHLQVWQPINCVQYDPLGPPPPCDPTNPNCFNKISGSGYGRLTERGPDGTLILNDRCTPNNLSSCATLDDADFTDEGEPNFNDNGEFSITPAAPNNGSSVLLACGCPPNARYQAHQIS